MARNQYLAYIATNVPFYTVHSIQGATWDQAVVKKYFLVCNNTFHSVTFFLRGPLAVSEHAE